MSDAAGRAVIDTDDMVAVHRVFRNAFSDAPGLINSAGDAARVQLVTDYYDNVFAFLHAHHEGEDSAITPTLIDRSATADEANEVTRIASQHADLLGPLANCETALHAWRDDPNEGSAAALEQSVAELDAILSRHADEEEATILPLCASHLTAEEWGAMPGHTLGSFTGDKIWLILGLVREQMTEQQRDAMLAHMPPPAVEMWTNMGNAAFDGFVTALRS